MAFATKAFACPALACPESRFTLLALVVSLLLVVTSIAQLRVPTQIARNQGGLATTAIAHREWRRESRRLATVGQRGSLRGLVYGHVRARRLCSTKRGGAKSALWFDFRDQHRRGLRYPPQLFVV